MRIPAGIESSFDMDAIAGGDAYWRQGRLIGGEQLPDGSILAKVRGSTGAEYMVGLAVEPDGYRISAWCECPHSRMRHRLCKHVWVVLLQIGGERLAAFGSKGRVVWRPPWYMPRGENEAAIGQGETWIPAWERLLAEPDEQPDEPSVEVVQALAREELVYLLCREPGQRVVDDVEIQLGMRTRLRNGRWGKIREPNLMRRSLPRLPEIDRQALMALRGGELAAEICEEPGYESYVERMLPDRWWVGAVALPELLPLLCRSGRLMFLDGDHDSITGPLAWDAASAWEFRLRVVRGEGGEVHVDGVLRRGDEELALDRVEMLFGCGIFLWGRTLARYESGGGHDWIHHLITEPLPPIAEKDVPRFIRSLLGRLQRPLVEVPEDLTWEKITVPPRPRLSIRAPLQSRRKRLSVPVQVFFEYQDRPILAGTLGRVVPEPEAERVIERDLDAERRALERLIELGYRPMASGPQGVGTGTVDDHLLAPMVIALNGEQWIIEAQGQRYRTVSGSSFSVRSGVDWFDLHAEVEFGGQVAGLPALLAALEAGEPMVRLDDGSYGMLPEKWLEKWSGLAGLARVEGDALRYSRSQAGLLDALLAAQPQVQVDRDFEQLRQRLRSFRGVKPRKEPRSFQGQLRSYQREGLGWMRFLEEFGFGGCLADDMGLGKTVQVLALLERCRTARGRGPRKPSLVVVPRTLIFNWKQEAARFAPKLKVVDHTGLDRGRRLDEMPSSGVVLTTYGTLRRDIPWLKDLPFDYVILDEAQAIKNPGTEAAKAARLLRADHRLALSGTPIENHLGELWSLFEFLNPGMLGACSTFRKWANKKNGDDGEEREILRQAVAPFVLRRTKEQVAADLPAKREQTIYCEMSDRQRRLYNELAQHYRGALLQRVAEVGLGRSKIHVLEALLRLRQAACHPGLVDGARSDVPSGKLEVLFDRLSEVGEEGHKSLVFSQFTSLLAIVRRQLDERGIRYVYLDGRTRKREARVRAFEEDPACPVFLISLKAGGLGLNLTAAEYVFLLDPWWNPAVEAQAIDRAHRIGQTRPVFAYRLISRGTVEEKVLELQAGKRELAASIIRADDGLLKRLTAADLEHLLS